MILRLITNTILNDNSEKDIRTWTRPKLRDGSDEGLFPQDSQSLQNKHTTVFISWRWQADTFPAWMSSLWFDWYVHIAQDPALSGFVTLTTSQNVSLSLISSPVSYSAEHCIHASLNAAQNWLDMPRQQSSNLMSVSETVCWIFHVPCYTLGMIESK